MDADQRVTIDLPNEIAGRHVACGDFSHVAAVGAATQLLQLQNLHVDTRMSDESRWRGFQERTTGR
jgi:hypothetical protein